MNITWPSILQTPIWTENHLQWRPLQHLTIPRRGKWRTSSPVPLASASWVPLCSGGGQLKSSGGQAADVFRCEDLPPCMNRFGELVAKSDNFVSRLWPFATKTKTKTMVLSPHEKSGAVAGWTNKALQLGAKPLGKQFWNCSDYFCCRLGLKKTRKQIWWFTMPPSVPVKDLVSWRKHWAPVVYKKTWHVRCQEVTCRSTRLDVFYRIWNVHIKIHLDLVKLSLLEAQETGQLSCWVRCQEPSKNHR